MTSIELCPKCKQAIEQDRRDKARARQQRWRERNPEETRKQNAIRTKRWKEANPERSKALRRKWEEANRDRLRGYLEKRRALKLNAFVEDVDRTVLYERDKGRCGICSKPVNADDFHVDHTIPLTQGGEHSYANCQIAHPACNLRKHNKLA